MGVFTFYSNRLIVGIRVFLGAFILFAEFPVYAQTLSQVSSPDGSGVVQIRTTRSSMQYRYAINGKDVIDWSDLGFVVNGVPTNRGIILKRLIPASVRTSFKWILGENNLVQNNYNEIKMECVARSLKLNLIIRVFRNCAAFRFQFPKQAGNNRLKISGEITQFALPGPASIFQYNQESVFRKFSLDSLKATSDLPSTIVTDNGNYLLIGEADNHNFAKGELCTRIGKNTLGITFRTDSIRKGENQIFRNDSTILLSGPANTPWRTISFATTAIGLHDFADLNLKLVGPTSEKAAVVPGKLIRAQLNTESGLEAVDFATKHNFQYILFDAGWYGAEFRTTSDPTTVIPALDLHRVIASAKAKRIGVILYVNYVSLKNQLDKILPLYRNWGVSGLKFGFVDGLTQKGIRWLDSAIRKVNSYGFVLDIHDNYKPTGLSARYPYLLTQEGVRGDENSPDAFHTTVLPFTRFLAGPADFTFCFPNPKNDFKKNLKVSKGHQLALTVVFFSPLQSVFWYGNARDYTNESEIEFFDYVPTVWDYSKYLKGEIGENISVARLNKGVWYIGSIAGTGDWDSSLIFDFLTKNIDYTATIYEDDGNMGISKRVINVKYGAPFPIHIKAGGGQAIIIRPKS